MLDRANTRAFELDAFRAVSDPTRRRILELLQESERSVTDLVLEFSISQPALSQHLRVLREANLASVRAEGRTRIYSIRSEPLTAISDWAGGFRRMWGRRIEPGGSTFDGDF